MSVRLSVNINKIALIRNSRGGNMPDLIQIARDIESFGADGITIHPRPDERHIRYADIPALKEVVTTELNVEGNPTDRFMYEVLQHKPHQCTLVPDSPLALTSDRGWDTVKEKSFLTDVVSTLQQNGIRVSIFIDASEAMVEGAAEIGTNRIEFYTGHYASQYNLNPEGAVADHIIAGVSAQNLGIGINAGHDLNLINLKYYAQQVPGLLEVSIGHALVCDALYYGLGNVVGMYKNLLR
ncbi:MAG: pyridoxine 5'-phosphate synthase [Saprospiraceae bacterium]|uniref:Pyridoxine 5'-phosphate synthase n=1 Tax=Candidatus Opimibacter skivensis TaxID=2982028 RepID=A0A9D7XRQ4_9BACT|nr:pyridoxine 5'-phosphate synthase [Candidatus Opimibacter skivensis]